MIKVVKSEWHQVEKVYGLELDIELLEEIYPDLTEDELKEKLVGIEDGTVDLDQVMEDAMENDVEIDWDYLDQDDWWTDRKGGYEVTYKVENWEHKEEYEPPKTHKCTKCRWSGSKWESRTVYLYEDGTVYSEDDLEFHHTKEVCPMCDSDLELTEAGVLDQEKTEKLKKELETMMFDEDDQNVGTPPSDEEMAEQLAVVDKMIEDEKQRELLVAYPPGTYTVELRGRGSEYGVSKITKSQYTYWKDNDELGDALNGDYDYDEANVPKKARFEYEYYNDYTDQGYFFGAEDDCFIVITNDQKEEIIRQNLSDFLSTIHGDLEYHEYLEETQEFYCKYDCKPGHYLLWSYGGKGTYLEYVVDIKEGETLELNKFKFETVDFEGTTLVTTVKYNDEVLESHGGDWDTKYGNFEVFEISKK